MYVKYFTSVCGINFLMKENVAKRIGQNIKQARNFKGYTQKYVANIFHMTQQQYSRFENGIFELNYSQILSICNLLDISPNELFDLK